MLVQIDFCQTPVGLLLSEWLLDQGLPTQGVLLQGQRVDPGLMLLAQAQGKELGFTNTDCPGPLEPNQVDRDLVAS